MDNNNLKTVLSEAKKCQNCYIKDGVPRCKKHGVRCNFLNCPEKHRDDINYSDGY